MSSEVRAPAGGPLVWASIEYLARNDFSMIRQVGERTLRAADGDTPVFVWLMAGPVVRVYVPQRIIDMAGEAHARIDVIVIDCGIDGEPNLRHHMNAIEKV